MAKIFKTTKDVADMVEHVFDETHLVSYGISIRVMSLTKAKEIIKVTKANAATEFLTNSDSIIQVFIYEEAFDRLSDPAKIKLIEGALSNVSFDAEKDKVLLDNSRYGELLRMRQKYEDYVDLLDYERIIIQQIEEEEKERKLQEKEAKKTKK